MTVDALSPTSLAAVIDALQAAGRDAEQLRRRNRALEQLVEIGIAVMAEPDLNSLIERVVLEARRLTNAEAGTLFLRRRGELVVGVAHNDCLLRTLGARRVERLREERIVIDDHSLVGYVACSAEVVNIADAYALPPGSPYCFSAAWDAWTGYRTRSVLVVPLVDRQGQVLGVLELINALGESGEVVPFDADCERLVRALGTQAAIAIDHARLTELSFVDAVTGAYNRRYFMLRLEEEVKRHRRYAEPFSIVLFDIDHFKVVNDRLGHPGGDRVLSSLGSLLMGQSRGYSVVGRLGGDEFGAILPNATADGAHRYADRIRRVVETYPFDDLRLSVSAGVASAPGDLGGAEPSAQRLLEAADRALYAAKAGGRNRVGAA